MKTKLTKIALEMPDFFEGTRPASSIPDDFVGPKQQTKNNQSAGSQYHRSQDIMQMQNAIKSLYETFKHYPMFNRPKDYKQMDRNPNTTEYEKDFEHGSDSFLASMMNRHVKMEDVGSEGVPKQMQDIVSLIESLNTFNKGNAKPDGIWGPYTNNAVKNTYTIAKAMMSMLNALQIKQESYTDQDLEELKNNIQDDPRKLENPSESAKVIVKNIAKIKMLLGSFVNGTTGKNSKLAPYINQQKAFELNYGKKPSDSKSLIGHNVAGSQIPVLNINVPKNPMHPDEGQIPLLLGHLASAESFRQFIKDSGIKVDDKDPTTKEDFDKIIQSIESKVKAANIKAQPQQSSSDPGY